MLNLITQVTWLALNIYFEAQGESMEGKIAVGHVVLNRVHEDGKSIQEVIHQKYQFSWVDDKLPDMIEYFDGFIESVHAAIVCLEERLSGETLQKANHYYNPKKCNPAWANDSRYNVIVVIGNHVFMRGPR